MTYTIFIQPVLGKGYEIPWYKSDNRKKLQGIADLINRDKYDTSRGTYVAVRFARVQKEGVHKILEKETTV